eukprot:Hpha_TRINITY_DN15916_c1_g1::TRINITY_DN15916_c1_g1_i1::g.72696::m.72696/K11450/KDM1A, AOF2, LSD1; lysine-specific histone demethylase 1A
MRFARGLQCTLCALLLSLSACGWAGIRRSESRPVLVVGAGMSGLSAAHALRTSHPGGVHVIEARDRIGGRIHTDRSLGFPVELGAAFIHRPDESSVTELARRLGVTLADYDYMNCTYFDGDGTAVPADVHRRVLEKFRQTMYSDLFDAVETWRNAPGGQNWDEPVAAALLEMGVYDELTDAFERRVFDTMIFQYVVQDLQADLRDVSAKEFEENMQFKKRALVQDKIFTGGFDRVLSGLAEGIDVRLGDPVESIRYRNHPGPVLKMMDLCEVQDWELWRSSLGLAVWEERMTKGRPVAQQDEEDEDEDEDEEEESEAAEKAKVDEEVASVRGTLFTRDWDQARRALSRIGIHLMMILAFLDDLSWIVLQAFGGEPGVEVRTKSGTVLTADKVVVTLPIGVLKKRRVNFDPPLPVTVLNAIQDLGVSNTLKVALCWKQEDVFWPTGTDQSLYFHKYPHPAHRERSGQLGRGDFIEFVNLHEFTGCGCLLAEVETDFASQLGFLDPKKAAARLMEDVRLMFGEAVPFPTRGVIMSDWASSPFSDGGLVHWPVDASIELAEEFEYDIARRIYWAGEHVLWRVYGNTHGARTSGLSAAEQVRWSYQQLRIGFLALGLAGVLLLLLCLQRR